LRGPYSILGRSAIFTILEAAITVNGLVISPEPFSQKCESLAKAKKPYLDVVDRRVRLAWVDGSDDGSIDFMERAEAIGLSISYELLLDALSEAGGAINTNGHYPINEAIKQRLRKL
jgi:hypothetical protein